MSHRCNVRLDTKFGFASRSAVFRPSSTTQLFAEKVASSDGFGKDPFGNHLLQQSAVWQLAQLKRPQRSRRGKLLRVCQTGMDGTVIQQTLHEQRKAVIVRCGRWPKLPLGVCAVRHFGHKALSIRPSFVDPKRLPKAGSQIAFVDVDGLGLPEIRGVLVQDRQQCPPCVREKCSS